ncbi:MAG TPA: chemotaxis protein CheW [Planctomycetota bacterium]|nr:chemotaxis protein CheW [Planctomycetota bacterium]
MISQQAVGEFLAETSEILDGMAASCAGGEDSARFRSALKNIEMGLHTIKGNAASYGFAEFSQAASETLACLQGGKETSRRDTAKPQSTKLVLAFVSRSREYVDLIKEGSPVRAGYFLSIFEECSRSDGSRRKEAGGAKPSPGAKSRPGSADGWEQEVTAILAKAPPVTPRIEGIVRIAFGKLNELEEEAAKKAAAPQVAEDCRASAGAEGPKAPAGAEVARAAPPAGTGQSSASRRESSEPVSRHPAAGSMRRAITKTQAASVTEASRAHGYAFEAVHAAAALRGLSAQCKADQKLGTLLSTASEILENFYNWSVEARSVRIGDTLRECIASAEKAAGPGAPKITAEIRGAATAVRPGAAQIVETWLGEVLRGAISAPSRRGSQTLNATISVESAPSEVSVRVFGLQGFHLARAKLQLHVLQHHLDKCGVTIARGRVENEAVITVPSDLDSLEVLVVRAGENLLAIPSHRVESIQDVPRGTEGLPRDEGHISLGGEKLQLLDLSGPGSAQATARPASAPGSIVIIRTDRGRQAIKVDQLFERQEMIAAVSGYTEAQKGYVGLSLAVKGTQCMPLLWGSSLFFEPEEALASNR